MPYNSTRNSCRSEILKMGKSGSAGCGSDNG